MKSFVSHWGPSRRVASSLLMAMAAVAAHAQQGGGQWELERSESSALGGGGGNPCYQHSYSGGPGGAVHTQRLVCGNQPWSGTATGNWSAPPSRLVPGERIQMNLSGSATASHSGINIGLNLSASFNAAGCGGSRNAVEIARLTVASNQPNTSRQVSGSAVVPGSGWSSDVPDLQGRLRLTVCMDGWGASYWYRWLPASTSSGGSRQETGPGRGHTDVVGPPESGSGPGTGPGAGGMLPITYSPWMSITPDQRQYVTQPGRAFPVPVVGAQHLTAGDYMVYTAVSEPNGRRISRWATHGPLTLRSGDKILAILNFNIPGSELQIERNSAALLPYSTPERGTAMVYARNMDASQWRSICLLPVGAAMSVRTHCFREGYPVEYVQEDGSQLPPVTYSPWNPVTRNQGQSIAQPARSIPVRVVGAQHLTPGDYMVYTAIADPNGHRISRWATHGPLTLRSGEKVLATLNHNPLGAELQIERDPPTLLRYDGPGRGTAMVYIRNTDPEHWRAICLLPAGAGMTVITNCFREGSPVKFVQEDGSPVLPVTYSTWMSITPDQRQYVTQPGRAFPVPVVGAQHLTAGDYMVYTAVSEPNGRRISRWATHGPLTLRSGDKILAILNFNIPGSELQIERNSAALLPYSTPERGTAMVYARNMDASQWRSICLLPVGAAMSVRTHCFRHDGPIEYVPDGTSGNSTDIPSHAQDTQPVRVFFNGNDGRVFNGPTRPTQVRFDRPVQINRITTYHWNNGQGTPVPGTIALMTSDGRWIGPWQAAGESGQGGAPNAYWSVTPNLVLPAGTYTIIDSDPSTWSHNSGSDGAGHAWIDGMRR